MCGALAWPFWGIMLVSPMGFCFLLHFTVVCTINGAIQGNCSVWGPFLPCGPWLNFLKNSFSCFLYCTHDTKNMFLYSVRLSPLTSPTPSSSSQLLFATSPLHLLLSGEAFRAQLQLSGRSQEAVSHMLNLRCPQRRMHGLFSCCAQRLGIPALSPLPSVLACVLEGGCHGRLTTDKLAVTAYENLEPLVSHL